MNDRVDREDWRHERSLQALGRAMRGEDDTPQPSGSLLSLAQATPADWRDNAVERHQIARSRREAAAERDAYISSAVTDDSAGPVAATSAEPAQDKLPPSPASWLPRWAQLKRARPDVEEIEAVEPAPERSGSAPAPDSVIAAEPDQQPGTTQLDAAQSDMDVRWKPLIDPMTVIGGVARSKALIVTMTLLGALVGISIALSTPKKYEAVTELIVDPRDLKITESDLTQTMIASDATLAIVENQMRVLTSGVVLNKVVDKLNLVSDPEFNGQGGSPGVLDLVRSLLSRDDGPGSADDTRRRALAVGNLAESISVERGGKTFVITVSAVTQDGDKSALIANTMTEVFLETYGQIQSDTAGRATDELTARLGELRKGVEEAERKVEEFRASHDLVDAQGRLISDDELLKLNEQLSLARAHTLELNARAASAKTVNVDSVLGGALPEEISSSAMADLRSQYSTLKQEADRAAVRLGPRHPERMALEAQLAGARDRIAAELRRIASSLQVDLRRAVQLEQELSARLAQLKVRSGDVSNDLVSLREFEREAAAKRSVYEAFLLRAKETSERRDINTANISVISKAFAPLEPNGPSRAVMALAGLLLGFASGVGLGATRGAYESLRATADEHTPQNRVPGRRREVALEGRNERFAPPQAPSGKAGIGSISPDVHEPAPDEAETGQPSIEEIRASLREFREAVRELAESRSRGRRV
ncbi:hypothetical protein ASD64_11830 [Mesorhizobium sp. Root157]|uniref:GumC family protein n=1 Tax=Mesorhizobium sp. Root157 TaxID=1736477 RepID=UPI0006FF564E|nr:GumC family protein [Mesorhizobium sp. Root157]KQZ79050.1 hypothetical protein ASD64_11830 [Mesorhizobium sp. Root157]